MTIYSLVELREMVLCPVTTVSVLVLAMSMVPLALDLTSLGRSPVRFQTFRRFVGGSTVVLVLMR